MVKIAICDDEKDTCTLLEQCIENLSHSMKIKMEPEIYYNVELLLEELERKEHYDIIFLDTELPQKGGIEVGKYLRDVCKDYQTQIIFMSSNQKNLRMLFGFFPTDFIMKPLSPEQIKGVLQKVIYLSGLWFGKFVYRQKQDLHFVNLRDILFFQSIGRKIKIMLSQDNIEFYGHLGEVLQQLPHREFLRIHKSYIVNINYIQIYNYDTLTLVTGETLPISQSRRKEVQIFLQQKINI